ncbi:MAG: hypothetical protein IE931_02975 [Sphingobacteriales bacterium]|nr:hypothetical protein [Sphingobacteriales bacterium]
MKNHPYLNLKPFAFYLLLTGFLLFSGMQCKKDATGIDALPPATQEGKETFGCLVNGEAFTPKGSNLGGPILSSYYQYLNSSTAQGYFFNVSAIKKNGGNNGTEGLSFGTISLPIQQGKTYVLGNNIVGNATARYGITININSNDFVTTKDYIGELYISKFDEINQIVSGTFWFDAVNDKADKVEVREGRFDVHYVE